MDTAATPKPSATIIICRDGSHGLEVFMVKRHHQIDFASGALVFPGGKVEKGDADPRVLEHCAGIGADDPLYAYKIAAIREAYEESGILFARESGKEELVSPTRLSEMEADRVALVNDTLDTLGFVTKHKLTLAGDKLVHFAHWITPELLPKRFDTHFYLGEAPADQIAMHDGAESVDSMWISPRQLLDDAENGKATVIFPTRCNLLVLAECGSVAEAMECGRRRAVVPVLPWFEQGDDSETYLCIPSEAEYPLTREKLSGAF